QMTFGVKLEALLALVTALCKDPNLIDSKGWATEFLQTVEFLRQTQMPEDTLGLAFLVRSYISGAENPTQLAYPKEALPLMARTDFHSMFQALGEKSRAAWAMLAPSLADGEDQSGMFKGGFHGDDGLEHGPSAGDWIKSIVAPPELSNEERAIIKEKFFSQLAFALGLAEENVADPAAALATASPGVLAARALIRDTGNAARELPSAADVEKLFQLLGQSALVKMVYRNFWGAITGSASKDLLSRGSVNSASGSMGAMKVPASGTEKGMAIVEDRLMKQWSPGGGGSAKEE